MLKYFDHILYAMAAAIMLLVIAGAMAQEESAKKQQREETEKQKQINERMPLIMQVVDGDQVAKQNQVSNKKQQRKFGHRLRQLLKRK